MHTPIREVERAESDEETNTPEEIRKDKDAVREQDEHIRQHREDMGKPSAQPGTQHNPTILETIAEAQQHQADHTTPIQHKPLAKAIPIVSLSSSQDRPLAPTQPTQKQDDEELMSNNSNKESPTHSTMKEKTTQEQAQERKISHNTASSSSTLLNPRPFNINFPWTTANPFHSNP